MGMAKAAAVALLAVLAAPVFAAPAAGQSFLGDWTTTATTEVGEVSEAVTVVKVDNAFAITAKLIGVPEGTPEAGPGTDVVLDGDKFSYKRTLTTPDGALVITYTGVVSGDTFTGTVNLGFAQAPYTGVRVKRRN